MLTKKRLTRVAPLRFGIMVGILYGLVTMFLAPIVGVVLLRLGGGKPTDTLISSYIVLPLIHAVWGFIGSIVIAVAYNSLAKVTGGIEYEVEEVTSI